MVILKVEKEQEILQEAKAYYRAYELTGDEFCLRLAQEFESDAAEICIEIMNWR